MLMSRRQLLWMFVDLATLLIECPAALLFLIGMHPENQDAFQVRIVKCCNQKGPGEVGLMRVNDRRRFYAHFSPAHIERDERANAHIGLSCN